MGVKNYVLIAFVIASVSAQSPFKVCILSTRTETCQALDKGDSQVVCAPIESKVDCALKLEKGEADFGVFTEDELLLLGQMQPNLHKVVASIKDANRQDPYAFEAVAVVSSLHVGGLQSLKGGKYCHPGLDVEDIRWSPRVLKTFESAATSSIPCPETSGKTAEELEVETLSSYFSAACRPGDWSNDATLDATLKSKYKNLCSLCAPNSCSSYPANTGVQIAGVNRNNRHIQALDCLRSNGNGTVAYVAWQHLKEYFTSGAVTDPTSYAVLCPDGTQRPLTNEVLAGISSPCAFVRQPYPAIVASTASATAIQTNLRKWWPNGSTPGGNTWTAALFNAVVGGSSARVVFEDLPTPAAYTGWSRNLTNIDSATSCMPPHRWCTSSTLENTKCQWLRTSSYVLGLQPPISCTLRTSVLECLKDIADNRADLVVTASNYGYLARQHYKLSPVKLVQNSRVNPTAFSRIAALIKESSAQGEINRFENLRDKNACFPEFGGIAFVSFVRAAHERSVISARECDYSKSVSEYFRGACAPGAQDAAHALSDHTSINAASLCSMCRAKVQVAGNSSTCAYDDTNAYYGNKGAISCLADPRTHVAFVEIQNINAQLQSLNLNASQFRALCRNNTLAARAGVDAIDENCLLAFTVDAEVLTRRNDKIYNSLSSLMDTIDAYFGYTVSGGFRLIDLKIYSPFNGVSDLLFKDSANGLSEPTNIAQNEPARNYIDLFAHLETCTGAAPGLATRSVLSIVSIVLMAVFAVVIC